MARTLTVLFLIFTAQSGAQVCHNGGELHKELGLCICTYSWTGKDCSEWKHHLCYFDDGFSYRGFLSRTNEGVRCAPWTTDSNKLYPLEENGVGVHNHCRNPDHDPKGLWCYVEGPELVGYCNATVCPDRFKSPPNITVKGRRKDGQDDTVRFLYGPLVSGICSGVVALLIIIVTAECCRRKRAHSNRSLTSNKALPSSPHEQHKSQPRGVITVNMDTGETMQVQ